MRMKVVLSLAAWTLGLLWWPERIQAAPKPAGQVVGLLKSKHDLSAANQTTIAAETEREVCNFCHGTHGSPGQPAMWQHKLSIAPYTPYSSSTLKATVGQPTGASKLCLSCHDGTVALGTMHGKGKGKGKGSESLVRMRGGVTTIPPGPSLLGRDLSDDHPVSMAYNSALAARNGQLHDPSTLKQQVRLDGDGMVQCTSCHDPHNSVNRHFLVLDDRGGRLCVACHNVRQWDASSHKTSPKTWNGNDQNPWPHTDYKTVADNACQNCHAPHNAGTRPRLLNFAIEEQNCNSCHNGNAAAKNVAAEFNKLSVHPINSTTDVHDPMESVINPARHVECVDCHNPHVANTTPAVAPAASGALAGVVGVNVAGAVVDPIANEYELCFRCHADSSARGPARVNRVVAQTNTRLSFSSGNASYHPVLARGKNSNVPSLISPWNVNSQMYCTDCHNNDAGPNSGGSGPNGPHGSIYPPLLERNLDLTDYNAESSASYALCYKCHSRSSILSDQSFKSHQLHVVREKTACTTCHDSHGVAATTHLINFNRNYVKPSANGRLEFVDQGFNQGNCSLTCHGKDHNALGY